MTVNSESFKSIIIIIIIIMLSRKFYDILFVVLVVLLIGVMLFNQFYFSKKFDNLSQDIFDNSQNAINDIVKQIVLTQLVYWIILFIYWIFILVLAIQLHSRNVLSTTNTIVIAILIPFSPIYYFTTLRKPLKQIESMNPY